jgi:hypothetical protein
MDPRAALDNVEKRKFLTLPGLQLRPLGSPSLSQSLYRLRYSCIYLIGTKYTITVNAREPVAGILEREINSSEQRTEVISRELTVVCRAI